MLKKLLATVLFGSVFLVGPGATLKPLSNDGCLLLNGCVYSGGVWSCPDPQIFMDCLTPGWP